MTDKQDPIAIDVQIVESYAGAGATNADIADMLGISEQELLEGCGVQLRKARATRRIRLRTRQFAIALEGNTTMLTWLGRHELQQNDKHEAGPDPVKMYMGVDLEQV